jgi:hypothetical protein
MGELSSAIKLTWNGLNMSALVDLHQRAVQLAKDGDYAGARVMFLEAIDGLGALMGVAHKSTICALESFVEFCIEQDCFDDAEQKLQESLTQHQDKWGEQDTRTLRSIATLGKLYRFQKRYGESEILLVKVKTGFENIFHTDPEGLFQNTYSIVMELEHLFRLQRDFIRAEQELLGLIAKGEALKDPYRISCMNLKYDLALLYFDKNWAREDQSFLPLAPLLKRERIILELTEYAEESELLTDLYLHAFGLLGKHYWLVAEYGKIGPLIERVENLLNSKRSQISKDTDTQEELLVLKWDLFELSYRIGRHEAARKYFTYLQEDIQERHGAESRETIDLLTITAGFYLFRDSPKEAEPLLQEAQRRAQTVLQPDDPLMASIMESIEKKKALFRPYYLPWWGRLT